VIPERLIKMDAEALRAAGLSRAKVTAVHDLAAHTQDGTVPGPEALQGMSDDEIVKRLTAVRGVGRWTVEMLLIFHLGRPDVLPVQDLGVRKGFRIVYGLDDLPAPRKLTRFAERWRPYRSVASWYMWRAVHLERGEG
jgi:3-methyladenine DNA glycosylase/8-oxoguanine DNA glycosylase